MSAHTSKGNFLLATKYPEGEVLLTGKNMEKMYAILEWRRLTIDQSWCPWIPRGLNKTAKYLMIQKSAQTPSIILMAILDNELTWKKYYSGYRLFARFTDILTQCKKVTDFPHYEQWLTHKSMKKSQDFELFQDHSWFLEQITKPPYRALHGIPLSQREKGHWNDWREPKQAENWLNRIPSL